MKGKYKILSSLLAILLIITFLQTVVFAETYSNPSIASGKANLITNASRINSITIANPNTSVATVKFFNVPGGTTSLTYTIGSYSNYVITPITITNIYTNVLGEIVTNSYPGISRTLTNVASATYNYPLITSVVVPTNSTIVLAPPNGWIANQGLLVTNDQTISVDIDYNKFK